MIISKVVEVLPFMTEESFFLSVPFKEGATLDALDGVDDISSKFYHYSKMEL